MVPKARKPGRISRLRQGFVEARRGDRGCDARLMRKKSTREARLLAVSHVQGLRKAPQ